MPLDVVLPLLGESVVEGTLTKWLVKEGDLVKAGQPLAEVASDKADSEVPAPEDGRVVALLIKEGDTVGVGKALLRLEAGATGSALSAPKPQAAPQATAAAPQAAPREGAEAGGAQAATSSVEPSVLLRATPSVRNLALEMNVDLKNVQPTGDGRRITVEDVRRAASGAAPAAASGAQAGHGQMIPGPTAQAAPAPAAQAVASPSGTAFLPPIPNVGFGAFKVPVYVPREGDQVVPFSRKRRITADHMVYSKFASPQVVTVAEVDLYRVMKLREAHKDRYKKEGVGLTVLAFVCSAAVRALRAHPQLNARVVEGAHVLLKDVNLGVAVDAPDGLVVPNLKHADELSLRGMARAIGDLAGRARDGKLTADDFSGSSFSITNPGAKGNLFGGAIISQPNVGILRMGEIKKRVVVDDEGGEDRMVIHPVMYLALTYDHRVVDGVLGNSFLWSIGETLKKGEFEPLEANASIFTTRRVLAAS